MYFFFCVFCTYLELIPTIASLKIHCVPVGLTDEVKGTGVWQSFTLKREDNLKDEDSGEDKDGKDELAEATERKDSVTLKSKKSG